MVKVAKVKTKFQKNKVDDERRKLSLKEKLKVKESQQNLIKNALLNIDGAATSKKKKFDSDEDNSEEEIVKSKEKDSRNVNFGKDKLVLFNESDSDHEESTNLNVKEQFQGKEGLKLLSLQSTYGDDSRFKIDERFIEEEESNEQSETIVAANGGDHDNICDPEEKNRQLQILGDVLGHPVTSNDTSKKDKKRTFEMIRYDESNTEHSKFVIQSEEPSKKKEKKTKRVAESNSTSKPVSKEKFYEVSSDLKIALEKSSKSTGFSLLKTLGRDNDDNDDDDDYDDYDTGNKRSFSKDDQVIKNCTNTKSENDFKNDKASDARVKKSKKYNYSDLKAFGVGDDDRRGSSSEDDDDYYERRTNNVDNKFKNESLSNNISEKGSKVKNVTKKDSNSQRVFKETFFFQKDDSRFKEGLDFMNKKSSEEAKSAQDALESNRGKLREVFRSSFRKQQRDKNPFKKKIGGMKIKLKRMQNSKNKPGNRTPGRRQKF